jgi:heme a synthase
MAARKLGGELRPPSRTSPQKSLRRQNGPLQGLPHQQGCAGFGDARKSRRSNLARLARALLRQGPRSLARDGARGALAWAAVVVVFLLMVIGNVVSATGSGLACPDWPLCHGRLIPPLRADVLIEYSHRLTAVLASVLLVATSILSIRAPHLTGARRVGIGLLVLLGVQIGLGGVTVLLRLPHLVSTAHLVNALLILGGLLLLTSGLDERKGAQDFFPHISRLARAALIVLLFQAALGGYVRHSGAGLACPDFPLCGGRVLPEHWLGVAHWLHRWLGVMLLGLFIQIGLATRRTPLAGGGVVTAALALVQVALGITTVLLQLAPPIRALHAATGYALWGATVWVGVRARSYDGLLSPGDRIRDRAAGIAHAP